MNAVTLVERENYMRQLYYINVDLKKQLRRDKNLKEIDLEAPLTRATQILKGIKDSGDLDASVTQELEIIISLLSSDQLFSPDIFQKPADSDVHDWLNDMLLPNIKKREPATISRKPAGETIKEEQQDLEEMGEHKLEDEPISIVDDLQQRLHLEFRKSEAAKKIEKSLESKIKDRRFFEMLSGFTDNPGFNVYTVDVESGGNSLYYVGWSVFKKHNLFSRFRISETKFLNWLTYIQAGYIRENPYHNHIHAADVTHSMQYYVTRNRIWDTLTPEEQLATVIAPIIHDYAHPGVNNAYLISTVDMLAIRYSDLAILEHFHCATIFEMMREDQYNIFENLSLEERKSIREMIISMVLATDMAHHFEWIGKFKTKMSGNGLNLDQKADRKLLLNMAIKCADVNNPSKPTDQSKMWTDLIMEEFFRQGEKEKAKGLPVSMFMNRDTTDVPKCQIVSGEAGGGG